MANRNVAVVTGSGGGIGRALCRALGRAGYHVVCAELRREALEEQIHALRSQQISCEPYAVDVADESAVQAFAAWMEAEQGRVDVLVNNAGVNVFGRFKEQRAQDFEWLMNINFWGVVHGCRHFMPLLERSRGHIVNMSSMAGMMGFPMQSSYCASKYAVRGFSAALRAECALDGVGVTTVLPGAIKTSLMRGSRSSDEEMSNAMAELMERFAVSPDRLASRILRAIAINQAELVVCLESHLTRWSQAFTPWLSRWTMRVLYAQWSARQERS